MKKEFRLKKNWEFDAIMLKKRYVSNKYVVVYFDKADDFKVGITVPKRFINAVGRNLYKRQLRSILQQFQIYKYNIHLVIIVRKDFIECKDFAKKQKEIEILLRKLLKKK